MWALGCIAFELCTLSLPFTAKSLLELACQIMEGDPTWSAWDGYFEELRDVTRRLLIKDMGGRPMASDLLAEPLFAQGGRATQPPSEEAWAVVLIESDTKSPTKNMQTPASQLTTKAGTDDSLDHLSDRSIETVQAAHSFQRELERARAENHQFSKQEFAELLNTHHELRLKELQACGSSMQKAQMSGNGQEVMETLV